MPSPFTDAEKASVDGLKVLVIDEEIPYPPNTGKRIRTWNLLRRLARRHRISLLCYGRGEEQVVSTVRSAGIDVRLVNPIANASGWSLYVRLFANLLSPYPYSVSKHYTRRFQKQLNLLLQERFDLLHCEWTPYARFLKAAAGIPTLISAHGIESQIWFRRSECSESLLEKAFFAFQALKMRRCERHELQQVGTVTAVSPLDANQLQAWGVRRICLVENGVDPEQFKPAAEPAGSANLLFVGSLDWHANQDAVRYLLQQIWPRIVVQQPQARLQIVGRRPPAKLREQIACVPGAELIGEVSDVRPFLSRAAVALVPLRVGGGTRVKILESLAMGKAVVSTAVGAEGLAVADGEHLLLADTPQEFAQGAIVLLRSPAERQRLGANGRKLILERYSWDHLACLLESAWYRACEFPTPNFSEPAIEQEGLQIRA